MPTPLRTAILGGGISGLALALALQRGQQADGRRELEVAVFERHGRDKPCGFGFLMLAGGIQALQGLDFDPRVQELGQPLNRLRLCHDNGEPIGEHRLEQVLAVDRSTLLRGLQGALPADAIRFNHDLQDLEWQGEWVQAAQFSHQRRHSADVFIGADGVNSHCRQHIVAMPPRPARVREIVARVELPELAAELGSDFLKLLDPRGGLAAGLIPLPRGRVVWFVQFDGERFAPPPPAGIPDFLQRHLGHFAQPLQRAIAATDLGQAHLWQPWDVDPPARLARGNLALVGDAAHPLLPFTSQGLNLALEDGVLLAETLLRCNSSADVPEALQRYAQRRQPLLPRYVALGRQMAGDFVAPLNTAGHRVPLAL